MTQRVIQIPLALVEAKMVSILLPLERAYAWLQGDVRQRQLKLNERVQRERVMRSRPGVPPPSLFNPLPRVEAPAVGAGVTVEDDIDLPARSLLRRVFDSVGFSSRS